MNKQIRLRAMLHAIALWFVCMVLISPSAVLAQIGLHYGDMATGTLVNATSIAMYRFEGEAGDSVTIHVLTDARCQPRLGLMTSALSQLAVSSPDSGPQNETEALLVFQLPDTAAYYITLSSANGTPCNFVLTLESERTDNPTASPAPAAPAVPTTAAQSLVPFDIHVSSNQTTMFTESVPALVFHQLRLRFVDLVNAQPQLFRITLTCVGNDGIMLEGMRCGDMFTITPSAAEAGLIPTHSINLAIPSAFTDAIPYTLTIVPESPLLVVAAADSDYLINIPLTTTTTFDQALSAPLGDTVDKISIRVPDLFTGSWEFTFSLLCAGTGVEFVQWSLQSGQVLACGDVLTQALAPAPNTNPIPSLDMFVALAGQTQSVYVDYTLLITPAGSAPVAAAGSYNFAVGLAGESQFLQSLSATSDYHTVNVNVPGVVSGFPRQIAFTLACASASTSDVKAGLAGVPDELVCGSSFQRSFSTASEQAQFSIQLNSASPVSYILWATPVYALVAPSDPDPHTVQLHTTQPVTLAEVISWPEGDNEDRILLDASQIRASALPRAYAITLNCEGPGANAVRGEADSLTFTCGTTFEYTFGASGSGEPAAGRTDPRDLPLSPGSTATPGRTTGDAATTLPIRIYLPTDAPPGLVNYVLRAVPVEQDSLSPAVTSSDFPVNASSTAVTTLSQTLAPAQQHRLQVRFPDLVNAHRQTVKLELLCTGVGTAFIHASADTGEGLLCGTSFDRVFESFSNNPLPGIDLVIEFVQTDALAEVNYTLRIEPVSPYVPVAPDDDNLDPYQLAISTTAQTVFSQALSTPWGDQADQIQALIPDMIGGQSAARNFTFWLECEGVGAGAARMTVELPASSTGPIFSYGLCGVPLPVYIDQSAGSPPALTIWVDMATTSQPAYASYTLYIVPDGVEPPFVIPATATPSATPVPAPTVMSSIPAPVMTAPSNGAIFSTQPVTVSWSSPPNNPRYELELQRCDLQGSNCITDLILVNGTSYALSVTSSSQIQGRVRALLSDGSLTDFSLPRTFLIHVDSPTVTPEPVLALIGPANGAIFDTQPVTLSWSALPNDPRYEVEIQRCALQSGACSIDLVTANTTSHSLSLATSAQITWRVRAILTDGSLTDYTPSRTFQVFLTGSTATPAQPLLPIITITPLATSTPIPSAPVDRDYALTIRAGEGTRISDAISFPEGDANDSISISVQGLSRAGQTYTLTLACVGVGVEFVRWEVRGFTGALTCGTAVAVTFTPQTSQQTVLVTLPRESGRSYVTYTLNIAPG